jgi:hypothetical protein
MKGKLGALGLLLLTGCGRDPFWYTDDVDFDFDFVTDAIALALGTTPGDDLETPYVRGTTVTIFAHTRRDGRFEDWSVQSADPDVFEVVSSTFLGEDSEGILAVEIHTTGAGEADLELLDAGGDVRDGVPVEVAFPDRVELHAAGPLFVGNPAVDTLSLQPQVLVGGTATFQVRYFWGDVQLAGRQVLSVDAIGAVTPVVEHTWLFEDRDWLQVTPVSAGPQDLDVLVDGEVVDTVTIDGVEADAVDRVEIFGRDEAGAEEGQWLVVLAQAFDVADEPVYGIEYTWDVNGAAEPGQGDLYRYEFDPASQDDVTASFGDWSADATIHAGEGYVDSSNNVGCTTTGTSPAGLLLIVVAAGFQPAARRRAKAAGSTRSG